ncbi:MULTISPECIES: TraC family protein [unclassified Novosphingobium]|uniref:TraC family protein n=1 Tax=unclassified Novosphingobium TaxID=2644732 RepID=UPI00086EB0D8|nr:MULTISPECIES: DUF5934 domain-containing protein [unclassified Novosphingobium]MBN9142429.1 TraC family protein [Novosphingobium sp.]ODU77533.1 MAG: type-IV secretion system protein TraC [Novosphingobium sp. SCN 63-17]OJX88271.1 MAG: type-IV secretion system protein TraC [Novosphingobium sp. 63-713]
MFSRLFEMITGDARLPERKAAIGDVPMLADRIGYRAYDPDKQLFHLTQSKGFILEICPLNGADERVGDILTTIFADQLLPGSEFQVINFASPRVAENLQGWAWERVKAGGVFDRLARYRLDLLRGGAWQSLASDGPFVLRNFRVLLSVGAREGAGLTSEDLLQMREGLISALDSIDVASRILDPTDLIRYIDDLLCPSSGAGDDVPDWSPRDPINEQCVRRDLVTRVDKDRVVLEAPSLRATGELVDGMPELADYAPDRFDVRTFAVRHWPRVWTPWDATRVVGDLFNPKMCLPCPVVQCLSGIMPSLESSETNAGYKFARTRSLADGTGAKLVPSIRTAAAEWEHVQQQVLLGQKLVQIYYCVTMLAPMGKGDTHARTIKALYKACGWDLADETYLHLLGLFAAMPLLLPDGLSSDLRRFKRLRKVLSENIAALAPLQGEYNGGPIPHLLLVGRRGQPQYWSPFQNASGNHNVAIAGKSGSGKSVLLQDLTASLAGVRAKVIVIDDGRSFEHMALALGGRFTEFNIAAGISINPFRMIDAALAGEDEDYLVDCLAMLKAIIAQMARFEDRLNDTERGLIDKAVNTVWAASGRDGTVDQIIAVLSDEGDHPLARDLALGLHPFSAQGTYGRFFLGEANLDLSADLTVFELSDLASRRELRSVVLTAIMFVASQAMRKLDRQIPKALIIDEAWQMLVGGAMADFVEAYARTCRKYGASLVTATQSVNDFYKSAGSQAAFENSDWALLLQQKAESIADIRKSARFDMSTYTETLLRSLKRQGSEYSDILVRGPDGEFVGRLVLDLYSATLYSSSPKTFQRIEAAVAAGYGMANAIEIVAFDRDLAGEAAA